jgi:hypothetical protein
LARGLIIEMISASGARGYFENAAISRAATNTICMPVRTGIPGTGWPAIVNFSRAA